MQSLAKWTLSLLLVSTAICTVLPAPAVELKSFSTPVPVKLHSTVNTLSTPVDTPFHIELQDDVHHQGKFIPNGTRIVGTLTEVRASRRWGRPARYKVQFHAAQLPHTSQLTALSDHDASPKKDSRLVTVKPFKRYSTGQQIKRILITKAISLAITIPLALTTDIEGWGLFAIDAAVDGVVGAATEVAIKDPMDDRSTGLKAGTGFLRGASPPVVPIMVYLLKKSPDIEHKEGQVISMRFPKAFWETMFTHSSSSSPVLVD